MTRHWLAFVAATAFTAAAAPATAQDRPPPPPMPMHNGHPMAPPPGWADPQAPRYPGPEAGPYPGAPYAHPAYPEAYHGGPEVHHDGPAPYPMVPDQYPGGPGGYVYGPTVWHGEDGAGGYIYSYAYQTGAPCGCPGNQVMWVPAPVQTRYSYSAPIRHERVVVEEKVVEHVVETKTVPVRREVKYVKTARAPRETKVTKDTKAHNTN